MYRIDVPSASPSLPTPAAAGVAGYFQDGDPVAGSPGTVVPADFMNMIMLELLAVVIAGGVTPSKTDHDQLLEGIKGLTTGSLVGNGYVKIPVGALTLIMNWGNSAHTDGSGAQQVTFAQPFSSSLLMSLAGNVAGGPPAAFHGTGAHLTTGMTVYSASSSGVAAGSGTAFRWLALGI